MSEEGKAEKFGRIALWIATVAFGLLMIVAGANKFTQPEMWTDYFTTWGYPAAFAYLIGGLEVMGGLALFVPRLATYAGGMIAVIMGGAAVTLIMNPGTLGPPTIPLVNVIAFAAIAYFRRGQRWTS